MRRQGVTRGTVGMIAAGVLVGAASGQGSTPPSGYDAGYGDQGRAEIVRPTASSLLLATGPAVDADGTAMLAGVTFPDGGYHGVAISVEPDGAAADVLTISPSVATIGHRAWRDSQGRRMLAGLRAGTDFSQRRTFLTRLTAGGTIDTTYGEDGFSPVLEQEPTSGCGYVLRHPQGALASCNSRLRRLDEDGALDPSWGDDGEVVLPFAPGASLTVAADGSVLAVGSGNSPDCLAVRLTDTGAFDPTFSGDGVAVVRSYTCPGSSAVLPRSDGSVVVLAEGRLYGIAADGSRLTGFGTDGVAQPLDDLSADFVTIDAQDRIVATGSSLSRTAKIARVDADGDLDLSFGNAGIVERPDLPSGLIHLGADRGGRTLLVIREELSPNSLMLSRVRLERLTESGQPDTDYGNGGRLLVERPQPVEQLVTAASVQPGGAVTTVSLALTLSGVDALVGRTGPDGRLDTSFSGGARTLPVPSGELAVVPVDVAATADGRAYVLGGFPDDPPRTFVSRIAADGTVDGSYGVDGRAVVRDALGNPVRLLRIATHGSGVVGVGAVGAEQRPVVIRLTEDGSADPLFGDGGIAPLVSPGATVEPSGIAVRPGGGIVVSVSARSGTCPNPCAEWASYLALRSDGAADPATTATGRPSAHTAALQLALDGAGRVLVGIPAGSRPSSRVVRFLPDGSLDPAFGNDGIAELRASGHPGEISGLTVDGLDRPVATMTVSDAVRTTSHVQRLTASGASDPTWSAPNATTDLGRLVGTGVAASGRVLAWGTRAGADSTRTLPSLIGLRGGEGPSLEPTPTPTPTPTPDPTPPPTLTPTPTPTPDPTPTPTSTSTPGPRPTPTPSPTPTPTPDPSPTPAPTPSPTPQPTPRPAPVPVNPDQAVRPTPQPQGTPVPAIANPLAAVAIPDRRARTVARTGLPIKVLSMVAGKARIDVQISERDRKRFKLPRRRVARVTRSVTPMQLATVTVRLPRALRNKRIRVGVRLVVRDATGAVVSAPVAETLLR